MSTTVRITILAPYMAGGHQPDTLASVWINERIIHQRPLGAWRKRVSWLPNWVPFNAWWDNSFAAQTAQLKRLEAQCEEMFGTVTRDYVVKGASR